MRICAFGDSFVAGTGDQTGLGWLGRLSKDLIARDPDTTVYNLGIRGNTSQMVQDRWRREFEARRKPGVPDRLIFSFGVNDCCDDEQGTGQRVAPDETLVAAEAVWVEALTLCPVTMIGPVPVALDGVNDRAQALDQSLAERAQAVGVPYIRVFADLLVVDLWMAEVASIDGAHPGERGYQILYERISADSAWKV